MAEQPTGKSKQIILLIGPKGSGKTFIGSLMEEYFGILFIRVEKWLLDIRKDRDLENKSYLNEVFTIIETGIREALIREDRIVFESTGLTDNFEEMLDSLKSDFQVVMIGIKASPELCIKRVHTRDQSTHINISDPEVHYINELVFKKNRVTDFEIDNNQKTVEDLKKELSYILRATNNQ